MIWQLLETFQCVHSFYLLYLSIFVVYFAGNSKPAHPHGHGHSAIKDLASGMLAGGGGACNEDKKDDGELWNTVEAQTAFLGPNLWDKTYETDLKVFTTHPPFEIWKILCFTINIQIIICSTWTSMNSCPKMASRWTVWAHTGPSALWAPHMGCPNENDHPAPAIACRRTRWTHRHLQIQVSIH